MSNSDLQLNCRFSDYKAPIHGDFLSGRRILRLFFRFRVSRNGKDLISEKCEHN